jgi:hypothetical protein
MSNFNSRLTADELRRTVRYNPDTGAFTWIAPVRGVTTGQPCGYVRASGYRTIMFGKTNYAAHRLAWLYVYGEWPRTFVDHINGVRDDNRIANLREATKSQNGENQRRAKSGSSSGLLGAHPHGSGFRSSIVQNGVTIRLGTFRTAEEAHHAYLSAKRALHGHCTI